MTQIHTETEIAIIGGGIHGAGIAQAAAAAGYRTALFEANDWACETSSRSSKLIHGGLRYLESFQLPLVYHSLRERTLLLQNAPDLVRLQQFHIPVYRTTRRRPWQLAVGLSLYRALAAFAPGSEWRSQSAAETPNPDGLKRDGLERVFSYRDGQTDDRRLTRAVVASANSLGAECRRGLALRRATPEAGGWQLELEGEAGTATCKARCIVNATGAGINRLLNDIEASLPALPIQLARGSHILLPGEVTAGIYYAEAPQDGRAVFTMPWYGNTLVGTTEHVHTDPTAPPVCTEAEAAYLLEVFRHYFPDRDTDILDSWAGLRVLPGGDGSLFTRARDTILLHHQAGPQSHYLGIYGGKLTAYRHTAQRAVDKLAKALGPRPAKADTRVLPLTAAAADALD